MQVGGIPPEYDNPLNGDGELGVAQALLNANHRLNSTRCAPSQAPSGNVYVTPEEMRGTGVQSKVTEVAPEQQSQRDSIYLAPVEERPGQMSLLVCPPLGLLPPDKDNSAAQSKDSSEEMMGCAYDTPKPSHIYAEIPCDEQEANIYEAIDDIKH